GGREWRRRPKSKGARYGSPPWTSLDDCDVVAEAKSPFSTSATDTPRSASSRATPAPAIPPPITTTSYSASSSAQGRPCTGSGAPTPRPVFDHFGRSLGRRPRRPADAPSPPPPSPYCPAATAVNFGERLRGRPRRDYGGATTNERARGSTGRRDRARSRRSARRRPS